MGRLGWFGRKHYSVRIIGNDVGVVDKITGSRYLDQEGEKVW